MASAVHTREVDTPADIHDVWRIVTDTDRIGRALGFDKIEVQPLAGAGAARFLISTKIAGMVVEYEEQPFEWVEPERYACRRLCRRGPLRSLSTTWELAAHGAGTHARFTVELEPARALMLPLARLAAQKSAASQIRALTDAVARLAQGQPIYVLPPVHAATGPALERATAALRALAGERLGALADRLVQLVREGDDPDVGRLRPFELAARWNVDRRDVVTVCLHGVSAGLLDLVWDLVCPSCRMASERLATLSDAGSAGHCQLCEVSFGIELERAIEATFRPAPAVRAVEDAPLCISGPARTPHVLAQKLLHAGAEAVLPAPTEPGRYRVFVRGGATATVEIEAGGAPAASFEAAEGVALVPAQAIVAPGGEVRVHRPAGAGDVHVKLERAEWASLATTAHFVSTLPAFRRQFGNHLLRPGLSLKVARASIVFSDLTASTALYAREGDAIAFKLVQDHFDVLGAAVEAHRGAIVKTIGDAIMAVFEDESDGVRGAVAMLRAFEAFRAGSELARRREVHLKVGLHAGACYVVTANKMLDYFGQSVNVAARLQALAAAGEVVVPAGLAEVAEASGWLEGAFVRERFMTPIKGLDVEVHAARVALRMVS